MGNQESVSNTTYVVKKKINKKKNNLDNNNIQEIQNNNRNNYNNNNNQNNNSNYNQNNNLNNNQNNNLNNNLNYNSNNFPPKIPTNNPNNYERDKLLSQKISNDTIIERNMLSDIFIKKNDNIYPYPSNSNNELDIPKKDFENIKFSPYNFNDEINKYKKNIDSERDNFDKTEKERREIFENNINMKKNFLNSEIKKFETEYNPWEILNIEKNDYNIDNIKKSYKRLALKYHPDKAGKKYEDKFQLITESYIYLLGKAEENNKISKKINAVVENTDYEDDINENNENIYVSKDKFNINDFNKIFDKYKIPNSFDKGYSNLMKEDIKNNDENVFGKKFNNDIFNAHFDTIKNKKESSDIIHYNEPEALDSCSGNLNQTFFGIDDIEDFGSMNNNNLSYTDYKKAHVDETLLIDINKVKYKTYNSIDQLESDRSNISYTPTQEDKIRYDFLERKKLEDDNIRIQYQKNYDDMINKQYNKINQKLIIHK